MTKLDKLKRWVELPDAAKDLSTFFGEEVSVADLLRFALDNHLKLSVRFMNLLVARPVKIVSYTDAEKYTVQDIDGNLHEIVMDYPDGEDKYLTAEQGIFILGGPFEAWDLPMKGKERLFVEQKYQEITGGHPLRVCYLDGPFVESNGQIFQIQKELTHDTSIEHDSALKNNERFLKQNPTFKLPEHTKYVPADSLPTDCVVVVRTDVLREFELSMRTETVLAEEDSGKNPHAVALCEGRSSYSSPKERTETKKTIIPRILAANDKELKWHHVTEVRQYMKERGISLQKESGLINAVKQGLKARGIPLPVGKPSKQRN